MTNFLLGFVFAYIFSFFVALIIGVFMKVNKREAMPDMPSTEPRPMSYKESRGRWY
jgi:hypothetical protein